MHSHIDIDPVFGAALVAGAIAGGWAAFCALKLAEWHKARRSARRYRFPVKGIDA